MASIRDRIVEIAYELRDRFTGRLSKVTGGIRDVESASTKSSKVIEANNNRVSKSFSVIGSSLKRLPALFSAVAAASGIGRSVTQYREFSKSISELAAITGASGKDLEFYSQAALRMGASTTFSGKEVAQAFKLIASAKPDLLESREALAAVTEEVLKLAEASGLSLADAATALGGSLNQFGAGADQAANFINVLAAGAKLGASEINDTALALKEVGSVAAGLGLSFEDTNAAIQALASVSIRGSQAGTGLRNVLLRLSTQTNKQFNPEMVGLATALENVAAANLTTIEKTKLFGRETIASATALINQADSVEVLTKQLAGTNTAYEQAAINTNNLDGDIKQLSSSWERAGLLLGETFNPALRGTTRLLSDAGNVFSSVVIAIKDMGDAIGAYAASVAALSRFDFSGIAQIQKERAERKAAHEEQLNQIWDVIGAKESAAKQDTGLDKIKGDADTAAEGLGNAERSEESLEKQTTRLSDALKQASTEAKNQVDEFNRVSQQADEVRQKFAELTAEIAGTAAKAEGFTFTDVVQAMTAAREALAAGDFSGAVEGAERAGEMLRDMKERGEESDGVLTALAMKLQDIVGQATQGQQQAELVDAEKALNDVDTLRAKIADISEGPVQLELDVDTTVLDGLRNQRPVVIPVQYAEVAPLAPPTVTQPVDVAIDADTSDASDKIVSDLAGQRIEVELDPQTRAVVEAISGIGDQFAALSVNLTEAIGGDPLQKTVELDVDQTELDALERTPIVIPVQFAVPDLPVSSTPQPVTVPVRYEVPQTIPAPGETEEGPAAIPPVVVPVEYDTSQARELDNINPQPVIVPVQFEVIDGVPSFGGAGSGLDSTVEDFLNEADKRGVRL